MDKENYSKHISNDEEYFENDSRWIRNTFLSQYIILPNHVKGYLDWVTGILRLNCTHDTYRVFTSKDEQEFDIYWETFIHEMFHFFQIISFGYLYKYVTKIGWEFLLNEDYQNDLVKQLKNTNEIKNSVKNIGDIYIKRYNTLSIIDLIEGHAFYSHNKSLLKLTDISSVEKIYKPYKNTIYHNAYKYMCDKIGNKAFYLFPGVCAISLSFTEPVLSFLELCDGAKKINPDVNEDNIENVLVDLVNLVYADIADHYETKLLKSPLEEQLEDTDTYNVFYTPIIRQLSKMEDFANIHYYMRNPQSFPSDIFLNAMRPILFNDATILVPKKLDKGIFASKSMHEDFLKSNAILSFNIFTKEHAKSHFFIPKAT